MHKVLILTIGTISHSIFEISNISQGILEFIVCRKFHKYSLNKQLLYTKHNSTSQRKSFTPLHWPKRRVQHSKEGTLKVCDSFFVFFVRSSAVADISISGFPVTFMTGECMRGPPSASTHSYCTYTRLIYVPTGTVLWDNRSYHASIKDCFFRTLRTRSTVKSGGAAHINQPCVVVSFSFSIYVFHEWRGKGVFVNT